MDKRLLELAVEIVQSQASLNKMSGEEIEATLIKVYNALNRIQDAEREGRSVISMNALSSELSFAESRISGKSSDPRTSIQEDKVICLECRAEFRQLTANHLKSHGLSPREYKRKWGFPLKQPLAARVLTNLRSKSAKKRGLPQKLQQYLENQRQNKRISATEDAVREETAGRAIRRSSA